MNPSQKLQLLPEQVSSDVLPEEQAFVALSELRQSRRTDSFPLQRKSLVHGKAFAFSWRNPRRTNGAPQPSSLQTTSASGWSKWASHTEDHD